MPDRALTDTAHWSAYWASRRPEPIPEQWYYADLLRRVVAGRKYSSFVELGGFPGSFAVYARRYLGFDNVALLDAFIDRSHLRGMLRVNGLDEGAIDVHEGDMFDVELPHRYDVVLSGGLVEHFSDPGDALACHHRWVKPGGTIVVTVPNFLGLNGLVQRRFDAANLATHNPNLMMPSVLAGELAAAGALESIEGFYYGAFRAWLEPGASFFARAALNGVRLAGITLDACRPRTRLTGRDVVAIGRKA
jgi:SAM-dependent methyltransferase